jgi:segregation and condensation protein B
VLFLATEPLSSRRISQLASLADGTEARTLIRRLNAWYDLEDSAFRVEEVAGGFQLLTRPRYALWLRRLAPAGGMVRLSAPALETLAVVAYRQPVSRAEVESIRGVQCGEVLRQLMERDLVKIVGKSAELGRPFLYGTTRRFLQVFGLRSLDELPGRDKFMPGSAPAFVPFTQTPTGEHAPCEKIEINNPAPDGRPPAGAPQATDQDHGINPIPTEEESHVTAISTEEHTLEERLQCSPFLVGLTPRPDDEEEDDDFDEFRDEDEDLEDDEEDEEDEDLEDDEDYEADEWEEVDGDDDEWDDDDDFDDEDEGEEEGEDDEEDDGWDDDED